MEQNLTKNDVIKIVREYFSEQGGTSSGFSVPLHDHNGADMVQVIMGNLAFDSRGLSFPSISGDYNVNVSEGINNHSILYISPPVDDFGNPLGDFALNGQDGKVFRNITFSASQAEALSVGDMTTSTNWLFQKGKTGIITNSPNFVLNFPDIDPLPPSPVAGDFTFSRGFFYGCKTNGTWTTII